MKKIVSIVLTVVMMVSMFTTVSAASVNDLTSYIPNPLEMELAVGVLARKSGTSDLYTAYLELEEGELANGVGVDYKATLDMEPIRLLFDKQFITTVLASDTTAQSEFDGGTVSTQVSVKITYPESADFVSDLSTAGVLDAGSIFHEVSRTPNGNVMTIVYKNQDNLTVGELSENKDTYLKDISFVLENDLSYHTEGYHEVKVEMEGATTISFASKTQTVEYSGEASHIVSAETLHILQVVPAVPATCEEKGWTEGVMCTTHNGYVCGAHGLVRPKQELEKLPHNTVRVNEVPATCAATGIKAHWICVLCKKDYKDEAATQEMPLDEIIISKAAHTIETIPAVSATCTDSGLSEGGVCTVCGHAETRVVIPATGHIEVVISAVVPDCTTPGSTEGKKCRICGRILVAVKPIAATGHSFGEWEIVTDATETSEGLKKRTCDCGEVEFLTIPKVQHTCVVDPAAAVVTKAATCTEAGSLQNYCACGLPVGDPVAIPAIGHNATKIEAVTATCTDKGLIEHWACANCQGLFRDAACTKPIQSAETPIDLHNHGDNKRAIPAIPATCDKDGLTAGEKCIACNMVTVPQIVVPMAHKFEIAEAKAATCDGKGVVEHLHCAECNLDFSHDGKKKLTIGDFELPALGHSFGTPTITVLPTEEAEGEGIRECTRCGDRKTVVIAKLEHKHNEICEEIITPASCTQNGVKRKVYTCCGEVVPGEDHIVIPAAHHPKKIAEVANDCVTTGVKEHYYCTVCEKLFANEDCTTETPMEALTTDKLLHNFELQGNGNISKCTICNEVVHIHKGENTDNVDVKDHGGIKGHEGKVKEDRGSEENSNRKVTVESNININDREISKELEDEIFRLSTASNEMIVFDFIVEKVTTYVNAEDESEILDVDKELVAETEDLITLEITIPESMRNMIDFMVHRRIMVDGEEIIETITTRANAFGEFIEIAGDKSKVILHVRKLAEYALAGYETKVNPSQSDGVSGGGGVGGLYPTIKFNANGGNIIGNMIVKPGEAIKLPIPVRDGYTFAGWYTDVALTIPFDPETEVSGTLTLYAKWIEGSAGPCDGTATMNCPCLKFVDLDPALWYHVGVDYVLNNGLMVGTEETVFEPDSSLTRAMLVTVLWRAEGKAEAAKECKFADVESGSYYEKAVAWAEECGIVTGYNDTEFGPHDNILREQIAAIMYRYAKFKGYDVSVGENTNILSYNDVAEISEYAIPAMQYAVGSGLMNGRTETTLNPQDDTTRAEIAVILYRFFTAHK